MKSQYTPFIVFSIESKENKIDLNTFIEFEKRLNDENIYFRGVSGKYNGELEFSYLVPSDDKNLEFAVKVMKEFNQESILLSDNEGHGTLLFNNGGIKNLGKIQVTDDKPNGDWSRISDNGLYFTYRR